MKESAMKAPAVTETATRGFRLIALYDIHGNLPALDAVIKQADLGSSDRLLIGGDVVPGPMPAETIARLRALATSSMHSVSFVRGNGETAVLESALSKPPSVRLPAAIQEAIDWNASQLDDRDIEFLAEWPTTRLVDVPGTGPVRFCHATPRNEFEIFTRSTPMEALRPVFDSVRESLVVCGHTHMQFDRLVGTALGTKRVVNAGSVGLPFGKAGAFWLEMSESELRLRSCSYDAEVALRIFEENRDSQGNRYPQLGQLEKDLLEPRSEAEMLELFGQAEVR